MKWKINGYSIPQVELVKLLYTLDPILLGKYFNIVNTWSFGRIVNFYFTYRWAIDIIQIFLLDLVIFFSDKKKDQLGGRKKNWKNIRMEFNLIYIFFKIYLISCFLVKINTNKNLIFQQIEIFLLFCCEINKNDEAILSFIIISQFSFLWSIKLSSKKTFLYWIIIISTQQSNVF